jgi:hypothetical protein
MEDADTEANEPVEPIEPAEPADSVDSEPAEPELTHETFDWDSWDGDHKRMPETVRGWAERLAAYYEKPVSAAREEAERVQRIYESLMEGREDPRLNELQQKLEQEQNGWRTEKTTLEDRLRQHEEQVKAYSEYYEQQATSAADEFKAANEWLFDEGPVQELASELLAKDGFDYKDLPTLLRMPDRALQMARDLMKEFGNPKLGKHAIELAKTKFAPVPVSQSERLVAGANGPVNTATEAAFEEPKDADYNTTKLRAVRLAMKRAS